MKMPWTKHRARDMELDEEIRAHFAMAVADRIAHGESPDEAFAAVRREFGNVGHIKEVTREMWGGIFAQRLAQDVRYAIRSLRRSPVFALVATVTLALGIGIATTMFTVVNGVLMRPLPFANPDRLVALSYTLPPGDPFNPFVGLYDWHFKQIVDNKTIFQQVATFSSNDMTLRERGEPALLDVAEVTSDFFPMLGVAPQVGRTFARQDAPASGDGAALILSDALWRARFGADSGVIGTTVSLGGVQRTIVGVMPATFDYPDRTDAWLPKTFTTRRGGVQMLTVLARLEQGMTLRTARAAFATEAAHFELLPETKRADYTANVVLLKDFIVGDATQPLAIFGAAVAFVLLIACANVANLLLMRMSVRAREMAVRAALGAGRGRLVRQALTETLVLTTVGALFGVALSVVAVRALVAFVPDGLIPRTETVHMNAMVWLFSVALTLATTLVCGLLPALRSSEPRLRASLAEGSRTFAPRGGWLGSLLVTAELAIAIVLLAGAGLMLRTFHRMRSVDPGFHASGLVTATIDLPANRYPDAPSMRAYHARVLGALGRVPGMSAVAMVNWLPFGGSLTAGDFKIDGGPELPSGFSADKMVVSPDYFRAMGMRIERGRAFNVMDRADAPSVVIVSRSVADRFWPNGNPIGERLRVQTADSGWSTIVGVVNDVIQLGVRSTPRPALYQAVAQTPQPFFLSHATFLIRPAGSSNLSATATAVRAAMREADPSLAQPTPVLYDDVVRETMGSTRFQAGVLVLFAALALVLAMVGVYGVIAYGVAQRRHEIGIRVAFGATPRDVTGMVLRRTLSLAIPGLVLGLGASFALTRFLESVLFQVTATDPATFVAAALLLVAVTLGASYAPARRASQVDPLVALRAD